MVEHSQPIDLDLARKLRDRTYRRKFFLAEVSAKIARQIVSLRKMRGLTQAELAREAGTQQPAISRCERADYQNWSFNTLRSIADALDARIRVIIEPAEAVIHEYEVSSVQPASAVKLAAAEAHPGMPAIASLKSALQWAEFENVNKGSTTSTVMQRSLQWASLAAASGQNRLLNESGTRQSVLN
jgi:transcriptional regulator with XRE-family HTH domain